MKTTSCFDNIDQNPLESLVLAHNENVHSAMIAWLVRNLTPEAKIALLSPIIGIDAADEIYAETEVADIDILITVTRGKNKSLYVIENKLKAAVREFSRGDGAITNQLERAVQNALQLAKSRDAKLIIPMTMLSYFAELPAGTNNWKTSSYENLKTGIDAALAHQEPSEIKNYLLNYSELVGRLVCAKKQVIELESTDIFANVPRNPDNGRGLSLAQYASRGRLKVLLQQIWLKELARRVGAEKHDWIVTFDSTHGNGLMNIGKIGHANTATELFWGIQLHNRVVRVFAQPHPFPRVASQEQHNAVERMLEDKVKPSLIAVYQLPPLGQPRVQGFRSYRTRPEPWNFGDFKACQHELSFLLKTLNAIPNG